MLALGGRLSRIPEHAMEWNGMEWKENFGMEDAQNEMKWNGRFEKWNGRSSSILLYLPNSELHVFKLKTNHKLNVVRSPIRKKQQHKFCLLVSSKLAVLWCQLEIHHAFTLQ